MSNISSFIRNVKAHFNTSIKSGDLIERTILIRDKCIKLIMSSNLVLDQIFPSISHREVPNRGVSDLTIHVWESSNCGTEPLHFPWTPDAIAQRGFVKGYNTSDFCCAYIHGAHGLNILDKTTSEGYCWINNMNHYPYYESAVPLRNILHWWFITEGVVLTHAAAISKFGKAVLIVGKGGSGKTTTALSSLKYGLNYISDDYCLTSISPVPTAINIYNSAKIESDSFQQFECFNNSVDSRSSASDKKLVLQLSNDYADKIVREANIEAVFVPVVTNKKTPEIHLISKGEALRNISPSSIFQVPLSGPIEFEHFSKLVKLIPCYSLSLSKDYEQNVKLIKDYLEKK